MRTIEAMINKVRLFAAEARSKDPTQPYEETSTEEGGYSCRPSCHALDPDPAIKTYRLTAKHGTQFTLVTWVSSKNFLQYSPLHPTMTKSFQAKVDLPNLIYLAFPTHRN